MLNVLIKNDVIPDFVTYNRDILSLTHVSYVKKILFFKNFACGVVRMTQPKDFHIGRHGRFKRFPIDGPPLSIGVGMQGDTDAASLCKLWKKEKWLVNRCQGQNAITWLGQESSGN